MRRNKPCSNTRSLVWKNALKFFHSHKSTEIGMNISNVRLCVNFSLLFGRHEDNSTKNPYTHTSHSYIVIKRETFSFMLNYSLSFLFIQIHWMVCDGNIKFQPKGEDAKSQVIFNKSYQAHIQTRNLVSTKSHSMELKVCLDNSVFSVTMEVRKRRNQRIELTQNLVGLTVLGSL